jgi:hypothetical protein
MHDIKPCSVSLICSESLNYISVPDLLSQVSISFLEVLPVFIKATANSKCTPLRFSSSPFPLSRLQPLSQLSQRELHARVQQPSRLTASRHSHQQRAIQFLPPSTSDSPTITIPLAGLNALEQETFTQQYLHYALTGGHRSPTLVTL